MFDVVNTSSIPVDVTIVAGKVALVMSDGSTRIGPTLPSFDPAALEALVASNRDAIAAILADDVADDARLDALATLLTSVQGTASANAARIAAVETRLSASEAILAAHTLAIDGLTAARAAHDASIASAQTSIGALQAAVSSLQSGGAANANAIASAQAAITALTAKVAADEATAMALAGTVASMQSAQTADEAKAAAAAADIDSLKASRATDEAAIAVAQAAIAALQGSGSTTASTIATLQATVSTAQAAIAANATAIASLQASRTADEASIVALAARTAALEAGAPYVYGRTRLVVASVDDAVAVENYRVFRGAQGRTYGFSLVAPSVANALSIDPAGKLSTVAAGFGTVAAEGTVTVTVRATDDQGATYDLAVTVVRRTVQTSAASTVTKRVLLGIMRVSASGTWTVASADASYPGWDELDVRCISGGSSGWNVSNTSEYAMGYCPGGAPGAVAVVERLQRADLVAAGGSVAVTVGAGGTVPPGDGIKRSNGGGGSAFGTYCRSAPGITWAQNTVSVQYIQFAVVTLPASSVSLGPVGTTPKIRGDNVLLNNGAGSPAGASLGPGGGGGGAYSYNLDAWYPGGNGGIGDYAGAANAGGAGAYGGVGGNGSNGNPGSYGGGGAGGGASPTSPANGGAGGYPGGGGGGAAAISSNPTNKSSPGAGGNGAIDILIWKRVAS
ncbi:hypothetical protein [Methylobacterium sp. MA0201]|uniref:hypothetical protein n=1 Tax=Methylobacterium alsaeris TaxID=3344826 RepID=UPI0037564011